MRAWGWALGGAAAAVAAFGLLPLRPRSAPPPQASNLEVVSTAAAPAVGYDIVKTYPHDPAAVTQGLVYRDGYLYESTGAHGAPSIRKVQLETGSVIGQRPVAAPHVGEGLTVWQDVLLQLTPVRTSAGVPAALRKTRDVDALTALLGRRLNMNFGVVLDADSLNVRRTFTYKGEGWGLTNDADRLILSDGTATVRFLDPRTFAESGSIQVTDRGSPVPLLNELELVDGRIYANVWLDDRIAIIDPSSGHVRGWIDLSKLWSRLEPRPDRDAGDVLNGIACDRAANRIFVTGKRWPQVFEIRVRASAAGS